ncbi:hypothetical protein H0H92_013458 [Tricholoma furcatifolium]|nr:hypothetical protein H0H92_013458 [Tricholoma furcatifolium]
MFYDDKSMDLKEGYRILMGGAPLVKDLDIKRDEDTTSDAWFKKAVASVILNKERISKVLTSLLELMETRMDTWGKEGQMDPFRDVYDLVFQMSVRLVTCNELANDINAVERLQSDFWKVEKSATPAALLLPWFPSQARKDKTAATKNLFVTLFRYVEARRATGGASFEAIDQMLNQGLGTNDIVTDWKSKVLDEVQTLITIYTADSLPTMPVHQRLAAVPVSAWEDKMPVTDAVLRETIRLVINAAALRRNLTEDVSVAGTLIPRGNFVVYPVWDTHFNPDIYDHPSEFDPARFGPGREEDKKIPMAYLGWGADIALKLFRLMSRHPCPGMKLAKLELKMIVAFFLVAYEFDIVDAAGKFPSGLPKPDCNDIHQARPKEPCYLKFKRVVE